MIAATAATLINPPLAAGVAVGVLALLVALRFPWVTVPATVILAFTALPEAVPRAISVGGLNAFLYEVALVAALAYVLVKREARHATDWVGVTVLAIAAGWALAGIANGFALSPVINDARGLVIVGIAVIVAGRVFGTRDAEVSVRVFKWVLWASLATIALGQIGLPIHGRSEDAGLYMVGATTYTGSGALRFITSATHASLATLCICVVLIIAARASFRTVLPWMLPATVIVFVSFSRNSLLALAVAILYVMVFHGRVRTVVRAAGTLVVGAVLVGVVYGVAQITGPGNFLAVQVEGYATRVVEGLSPDVLSTDTSALWRARENALMLDAIDQSPLFGHGMGYAYRPPTGVAGSFEATTAQFYAHNYYYWLPMKVGLIAAVTLGLIVLRVLCRRMTNAPGTVIAAASGLAGLLAVSAFAPLPNSPESGASLLIGALIGTAAAWSKTARADQPSKISKRSQYVNPVSIQVT